MCSVVCRLLTETTNELANWHLRAGNAVQAACCHLATNDVHVRESETPYNLTCIILV